MDLHFEEQYFLNCGSKLDRLNFCSALLSLLSLSFALFRCFFTFGFDKAIFVMWFFSFFICVVLSTLDVQTMHTVRNCAEWVKCNTSTTIQFIFPLASRFSCTETDRREFLFLSIEYCSAAFPDLQQKVAIEA